MDGRQTEQGAALRADEADKLVGTWRKPKRPHYLRALTPLRVCANGADSSCVAHWLDADGSRELWGIRSLAELTVPATPREVLDAYLATLTPEQRARVRILTSGEDDTFINVDLTTLVEIENSDAWWDGAGELGIDAMLSALDAALATPAPSVIVDDGAVFVDGFRVRYRDAPARPEVGSVPVAVGQRRDVPSLGPCDVLEIRGADYTDSWPYKLRNATGSHYWWGREAVEQSPLIEPATPAQAGETVDARCPEHTEEDCAACDESNAQAYAHAVGAENDALRAERDKLADRVRELEGKIVAIEGTPQPAARSELERALLVAACANVDAWRKVATAEAVTPSGNLMLESVRRRALYAAKAFAQIACIELQDAVDAFRKAGG